MGARQDGAHFPPSSGQRSRAKRGQPALHRPAAEMLAQVVFLALVSSAVGLPGALLSQYHAQDELGQYTFGYSNPSSTKHETKTADGVTRGSYSYIDAFGRLQTRSYTADDLNGFRVTASDLPTQISTLYSPGLPQLTYQPSRTSLVSGARPLQQAQQASWALPAYQSGASKQQQKPQPQQQLSGSERPAAVDGPVRDTQAVAAAKAQHLAAVEQAKARNAAAGGGDQSGDYYGDDSESISTAYPSQFYNPSPPPSASFPVEHRYLAAIGDPYLAQGAVFGQQQAVPVLPFGLSSQYHAQDEAGQYTFGYANDIASKSETKTLDGVTRGSFSYLDPYGLIQTRTYVADDDGFRVVASDLPQVRI